VNFTPGDLHLSWDVAYEPGTIKAVGRKNGKQVIIDEIQTTGQPAALHITTDGALVMADGKDVALVHVDVVDANGNVVPDASNTISFTVTGEGKLLGVDNGDLRDDDSFKLDSRKAFNGHAYAVIQAGSKPGDIKLLVQADGLKTASILIETQPANPTVMTFDDLK
jgi:beta-galactosidase